MKLKTLDNLNGETWEEPTIERLQEEAIKYIKQLEKHKLEEIERWRKEETHIKFEYLKDKIIYGFDGTINWIKHFFGIKESDLE